MFELGIVDVDVVRSDEVKRLKQEIAGLRKTVAELTAIIEGELILNRSHSSTIEKDFEF
jgi:hypothetical protein